jgi:hypothetical protein
VHHRSAAHIVLCGQWAQLAHDDAEKLLQHHHYATHEFVSPVFCRAPSRNSRGCPFGPPFLSAGKQ